MRPRRRALWADAVGMMVGGKGEGWDVISEQLSVIGETAKVAGCKLQVAGSAGWAGGLLDSWIVGLMSGSRGRPSARVEGSATKVAGCKLRVAGLARWADGWLDWSSFVKGTMEDGWMVGLLRSAGVELSSLICFHICPRD